MAATTYFLLPASGQQGIATVTLDLKSVTDDGVFEGYASLFNREDLGHDVVLPGAFVETLRQRGVGAIKMLLQHNPSEPIGVWDEIREDERGLFVRGRLMTAVAKAREVLALMRAGALDGLSIGFKPVRGRRDHRSGVRRLEKVDLWEISIVTFPMLPGARVANVKARPFATAPPTQRQFERRLTRDAGLTRTEAHAVMGAGFSGLKALRDAGRGMDDDAAIANRLRAMARRIATSSKP